MLNIENKKLKKIIIISLIIIILIIITIFFYKMNTKNYDISIEIASDNISYTYGPNNQSDATVSVNGEIKLNILSDNANKAKCYSSNENIMIFNSKNIATAISKGKTEIYCKIGNTKSNIINVVVGG